MTFTNEKNKYSAKMDYTLLVLIWKHSMVRIRRFIHTTVELVSPIVLFLLMYSFKDLTNPAPLSQNIVESSKIQYTESIPLIDHKMSSRIFYHPDTKLTGLLMDSVAEEIHLKRQPYRHGDYRRGIYPLLNESMIPELLLNPMDAIIMFQDMNGEEWPRKLNYTIRMKEEFNTEIVEPLDGTIQPHSSYGTDYESFMRLQWAIDTSYIKLLSGKEIAQEVTVQELPFYRKDDNQIIIMLCEMIMVLCWLSLMLVFVFLVCRLLEEKATGIKELIKMVGVSSNTLGISHFLNVLPAGLLYSVLGAVLMTVTSNPIIPNTSGIFILIALFLHYVSVVALAFACSYIANSTQYSVSLSVICYVLLWIPTQVIFMYRIPLAITIITGVLPHVPIYWFWKEVAALERHGESINISSMMRVHDEHSASVLLSYVMMLVQIVVYFAISWYLSLVRPGQYGQALPWNFLFTKQYWAKNEVGPRSLLDEEEEDEHIAEDRRFFEEPPGDLEVGIRIVNVSKMFPKQKALNNVSLEVYKGEITVLLGHNGAGKTTLMSIITGMTSATEGEVYVNGMNTVTEQADVRKHLGLCPQHNLFFSDLTVLEHVMFFTMLKGVRYRVARSNSQQLLEKLGIGEKGGSKSGELSGGMKRRLQLACALAGNADVLILDEPTSGLDVETRRELWDLLLSLRGSRTVLLTTHFMEEAEALGDRVAALHHGALRCHATTMHLKKAIGTGYRLSFTTIGAPNSDAITSLVTSQVPDATLKEKTMNSLSYNLPAISSDKFPTLFTDLESKRSELGIDSIGVGISTLEEVFLKLCSDVDNSLTDDEIDGTTNGTEKALMNVKTTTGSENNPVIEKNRQETRSERQYTKLTGARLYLRQSIVLLKRQVKYLISKKWSFLFMQVLLPVFLLCVFTNTYNNGRDVVIEGDKPIALNLDLYSMMKDKRAFYNINATDNPLRTIIDKYSNVEFQEASDIPDVALAIAKDDVTEYKKYLIGIELNNTNSKILYTTTVRHAAPVALNLLSNMFASQYLPADGATITTLNSPLSRTTTYNPMYKEPKAMFLGIMWILCIIVIILATNINAASLPCKERASGSRHIHIMSGCPPELHWLSTLLFHMTVCMLVLIIPTLLIAKGLEGDHTIDQPDFLCALLVILLLGCLSFFALTYIITFLCSERVAGIVLLPFLIIFGCITPTITVVKDLLEDESRGVMYYVLMLANYVMPPHTLVSASAKAVHVARLNAFCTLNRALCPNLYMDNDEAFDAVRCCAGEDPADYFRMNQYAPLAEIIILAVQFVAFMLMVFLLERGMFNSLLDRLMNLRYSASARTERTDALRAEAAYVAKAIELPDQQIKDAMLVHDVHKNYPSIFGKSCNAVKGISFSVKKGECFGLLGVNGAGKSTTFKMLTAEECTTRGDIFANGYRIKKNTGKYLRTLGYCPQFFGLDDFQTGKENLALLLTLRGLQGDDVEDEVKNWIQVVGLEKYRNRLVSGYSGGCARRLAAAAALCSGAALTLLDEPTAGVDVSARRRVWAALRRALAHGRAVIITSHSMDEMEALCSSIAIMSRGEICALGSAAALRAAHAAGHAVLIKVKRTRVNGDEVDTSKSELDRLKGALHQTFDCTLKDEHKTMLHYHINETMRYSDLFTHLEGLKSTFPNLVEDYSVTETTLEEVFLSFAKENNEPQTV